MPSLVFFHLTSSTPTPFLSLSLSLSLSPVFPNIQYNTMPTQCPNSSLPHFLLLIFCISNFTLLSSASRRPSTPSHDAALLRFKSKADLTNQLNFSSTLRFCQWPGVTCYQFKVVRLVIEHLHLAGVFAPATLSLLPDLRVLSLQNTSLTGPVPDLAALVNLKALFLNHNHFTGSFPPSISSLHRLRTLDLSFNNLTGQIPASFTLMERLYYLRLEFNRLNGTIPALNQSSLKTFNVSRNNLTGPIPVTPALQRFGFSSFSWNPGLCGEILHKECRPRPHFFGSNSAALPPSPTVVIGQSAEVHGVALVQRSPRKHDRRSLIIGFGSGVSVLMGSVLCFAMAVRRQRNQKEKSSVMERDAAAVAEAAAVIQLEQESELEEKVKRLQGMVAAKSGALVFCAGEAQIYTLEQLMRASAELLGKGTMGTTYKAVLDNDLILTVKRLDATKLAGTAKDVFEHHMESVGGLRHPNLVPLRAYFQAKDERLIVYDYQPNGSLFSLIHGSKSTVAKPLHWTSCLKIAEDVAQGLSYIHQAWRLVHGNLKSSNVLLGADFEACIADYCIKTLSLSSSTSPTEEDPGNLACKAPETRNSSRRQPTAKSDVYSFGILLLELLTGKPAAELPVLGPDEMEVWVRSTREEVSGGGMDEQLVMLAEVATACSLTSPEQRPTMWQVLKMLQEIKEEAAAAVMDEVELDPPSGLSST